MIWLRRYGFRVGPLNVTWTDLWTGTRGLEVAFGGYGRRRCHSVSVGFRGVP